MFEVRFHGRGGQGAFVSAIIMVSAALEEGKYALAFPFFGGERRGAPVQAFLRISDSAAGAPRMQIYEPDCVVVLDPSLLTPAALRGLKERGWVIANTSRDPQELDLPPHFRVGTVNATAIAEKHGLGYAAVRPVNTAILGALVKVTGLVSLAHLERAIQKEVPARREENVAAAREAFAAVKSSRG